MNPNRSSAALVLQSTVVLLAVLLLSACGDGAGVPSEPLATVLDDSAVEHALKHADPKYVCPMHPQIIRDQPGTCPICGMNLVAQAIQSGAATASGPPIVTIRPETIQNMGVRTARVERGVLWKYIDTLGYVTRDEDHLSHVHARADGWIEKLLVRAEGDQVKKGQVLMQLYSPEIVSVQEEYLIALRNSKSKVLGEGATSLLAAAAERLRLLEVPRVVLRDLDREQRVRRTVPVLAPQSGIVTNLAVRDGMYVTPSLRQMSIIDLATVWVLVDVFEHQQAWVVPGRPAEIRVGAFPGRVWEGAVDYVYPEMDPKTRTLRVRLHFANPDGALKPNMLADAVIYGGPKRDVLVIPRESLIVTGERQAVVRALGEGRFQPRDVVTGMQSGGRVEVLNGLEAGDEVVLSGQFLIDSESNLQASFLRFGEGE